MTAGRPGTPFRGARPAGGASGGEVLFEFITRGASVRVAAIDVDTGVEVVVVGPANASEIHLKGVALRKLRMRLGRG